MLITGKFLIELELSHKMIQLIDIIKGMTIACIQGPVLMHTRIHLIYNRQVKEKNKVISELTKFSWEIQLK